MSIPASVGLYVNWVNGSYSSPTYTAASPDKPNSQAWTKTGTGFSIAVDNDSPWSGQTCAFVTDANNDYVDATVTSSEVQATSGRVLVEVQVGTWGGLRHQFWMFATNWWDGRLTIRENTGGVLYVRMEWQGGQTAFVDLGAHPTGAYVVEVIYDTNNATASQRLRARTWTLGGTPGSFTDTGSSSSAGSTNQFVTVRLGDNGSGVDAQFGRVMVSSDISEDLSAVTEGGGATGQPTMARHNGTPGMSKGASFGRGW